MHIKMAYARKKGLSCNACVGNTMTKTPTLMVQGTTSDAGKSTLVAGLGRILLRRGIQVAPFKPQNMALNSAVTVDGGEIGRAQAVQALACGLEPHTDMNPILLKPTSDKNAQVIIHGKAIGEQNAKDYHDYKKVALDAVLESYARLSETYEAIVVEGAGSPAEINLRENDIANMGFAEAVDCPVIIVADIDRGGVFAHLVGTLALLSETEQSRVKGFVINRFRGDLSLLQSGLDWLENETKKTVLGVLPYIHGFHLEAEDALSRETENTAGLAQAKLNKFRIIVPVLPRISNHTDFDPLRLHPDIDFQFIGPDQVIPPADLIIIPGSKSVMADLSWLRSQGWENVINRHLRYGGKVLAICGGYQMLGHYIYDPLAIESTISNTPGFGLLDIETTLQANKHLKNISGHLVLDNTPMNGYEIHAGFTTGSGLENPVLKIGDRTDGAISPDNQIMGCYAHGLFDATIACQSLLSWAGLPEAKPFDYAELREAEINRLADIMESHMDMEKILNIMSLEKR